tara:strand:+ start:6201 stop:7538 length:1338 start_codon:yes stop_codon:yes gene_type:complete
MNKGEINKLLNDLFPLNRSITGNGLRESFKVLYEFVPFNLKEIPSNFNIGDWTVPHEWNVEEAYIKNSKNEKILDYEDSNLHVINYSTKLQGKFNLKELNNYLYSNPQAPKAIPYITSYYDKISGFCMDHETYKSLKEDEYEVLINSEHFLGSMTIGECVLEGETKEEVLISSYLCHPSMGNNELSGPIVLTYLYDALKKQKNKYTYRFVIFPETIGAIAYLSYSYEKLKDNINYGLVLTCLGGPTENISYKESRLGNSGFDKFIKKSGNINIREFTPINGSNERHFCFPTVDFPIGQFARTIYQQYPEYHTSLDDKKFVNTDNLLKSSSEIYKTIKNYEKISNKKERISPEERREKSKNKELFSMATSEFGEPFLSKYDLYPKQNFDGAKGKSDRNETNDILKILSMSDGVTNLSFIENKLEIEKNYFQLLLEKLESNGLIKIN